MDIVRWAIESAEWIASWFFPFAQTPGFAGILAVVAAVVAYLATTRNSRKDRWWKRAEYALDLTLSDDEAVQLIGLAMLQSLRSHDRHEQDFIKAATDVFLDPDADGDEHDDESVDGEDRAPTDRSELPWVRRLARGVGGFLRRGRR